MYRVFRAVNGQFCPLGTRAMRRIFALFKDQKAATAVEYGLILALIFLAMIAGVSNFASATINMWNNVEQKVRTS